MAGTTTIVSRTGKTASDGQEAVAKAWQRVKDSARRALATGSVAAGEAYNSALRLEGQQRAQPLADETP